MYYVFGLVKDKYGDMVRGTLCRDGVIRGPGCSPYYFQKWKTQTGAMRGLKRQQAFDDKYEAAYKKSGLRWNRSPSLWVDTW